MDEDFEMKKAQRYLSMVLAAVMAVSIALIPVSASNSYNITKYVAFGDSIGAGMNNDVESPRIYTGQTDGDGSKIFKRLFGSTDISYITKVADYLGLSEKDDSYKSWAYCAFRASEVRMLIDPDFTYDDGYMGLMTCGPEISEIEAQTPAVVEDIKQADLITINIGSNDIFVEPLAFATRDVTGQNTNVKTALAGITDQIATSEGIDSMLELVMSTMKAFGLLNEFVISFVKYVAEGFVEYQQNLEPILQKIREYNPDAQIIMVGVYNPLHYTSLTGSEYLTIGQILDSVVAPINMYTALFQSKYNFTFADMNGTKVDSSNHPSEEGYQFMADRIIENLKVMPRFKDIGSCTTEEQTAVEWAVNNGVTAGTSSNTFSPDSTTTRAQIMTFLWKTAGSPDPKSSNNPFNDVKSNTYYNKAVLWAVENGITAGTSENEFSPNQTCTKGQILTFLYRYAGSPEVSSKECIYSDISETYYGKIPVLWAVERGIAQAEGLFTFGAESPCTRIDAVTYLYRLCK